MQWMSHLWRNIPRHRCLVFSNLHPRWVCICCTCEAFHIELAWRRLYYCPACRNKILRCGDLSDLHVPGCIWVLFCFVWFVFIHHSFQFYFELCTYYNILDIYLLYNLNYVNYLLFYMKLLNYWFFNMFGSVLECYELTGVSLLWTRRALANKAKIGLVWKKYWALLRSLRRLYSNCKFQGLFWSVWYKCYRFR